MKIRLLVSFLFCSLLAAAQKTYWQQQVNHTIEVSLNDKEHSLKGFQTIEYSNNSPDQLLYIPFHLWTNAFKNESSAYARQVMRGDKGAKILRSIKDKGYVDSLDFKVNGEKAEIEADRDHIDIVRLLLPRPLPPGGKITITTPFYVKIPTYVSRSGHIGRSYMMCQWYPKPAVYDANGWHAMPYLAQGEYYNEFGNYDVSITLPSDYIVAATGSLQTAAELEQYKAMGTENLRNSSRQNRMPYKPSANPVKTLRYTIDSVTDFSWFADKDFVIRYDSLQLDNRMVDVFTYHHPDGNGNWIKSTGYLKTNVRKYSDYIGPYAYPVVQAVEGPKNESSGGMEYPTITLITSPSANAEGLEAVLAHEVGHNWFPMMLASNERNFAWMDEGINSYYQFRYEAEVNKSNMVFGSQLPEEIKAKPTPEFLAIVYNALNKIPMEGAIDTPAAAFKDEESYGMVTYLKTAVWLYYIELNVGRQNLDRAMQAYFRQWKFKHPQPSDLKATLEKELRTNMDAYFNMLKQNENFQ